MTFISWRLINSRFGVVIRGAQENEMRLHALGFSTFRYKLLAFTIAGSMCGLSGFLYANLNEFVTPEYMHWFRSGEIMIMVLVGGMGTLFGPLFGAAAYLLFEEIKQRGIFKRKNLEPYFPDFNVTRKKLRYCLSHNGQARVMQNIMTLSIKSIKGEGVITMQ